MALLKAQIPVGELLDSLEGDERTGASIVHRALEEPIRQIARNAGADGSIVVDKVRNQGDTLGFNALTGEYEDLVRPASSTRRWSPGARCRTRPPSAASSSPPM